MCSHADASTNRQVRKTALREVRILRALRHDNVVSLLDVFRQSSRLYLVFEFCERTGAWLVVWLVRVVCGWAAKTCAAAEQSSS